MRKFLLRDLTPGTDYAIQVRSVSQNGVSEWSRKFPLTTQADVTPPVAPSWTDPEANAWVVDGDTFVATWQPVDLNIDQNKDFSYYELLLDDGTKTVTVATTNTTYVLSFEQNRAFFGTPRATVSASVRTVDQTGNASVTNTELSATNPAPAAVTGLTATEQIDAILLNWNANLDPDFQYYLVQVSTTGVGGSYTSVYSGTSNSFTHSTTQSGTDHFYRVYAVDKFNTTSPVTTSGAVRPDSAFGSDTTPPNNATGFNVTTSFDLTRQESILTASWTASTSTDVGRYIVRYSPTDPAGTAQWNYVEAPHDATTIAINGVIPNQNYWTQIRAVDFSGNVSAWANATTYPRLSAKDTTAPPTPATPTAAVGTMKLQVVINGLDSVGAAMPADVSHYEVYASTTNGFTTYNNTTMLGTIQNGPAIIETFNIPASNASGTTQTWYVKVMAVDRSNNKSDASAQATAAVGLIVTANIGDAQITNAKINDLSASKITAGTINTGDINVQSRIVLGTSGNDGVIESYDFGTSGGTTGFSLDSDGLIIKTGQVEAAALRIQNGVNVGPIGFCDFEFAPSFYPTLEPSDPTFIPWVDNATGIVVSVSTEQAKFGSTSLKIVNSAAAARTIYLSHNVTNYNIVLAPSQAYIVSAYVYNSNTAQTPNWRLGFKQQDASIVWGTAVALPGAVGWSRVNWVITTSAVANSGMVVIESQGDSTFYVDGIQVEKQISGSTTPSPWAPPSMTIIDGGSIRTGSVQSTQNAVDASGAEIPDIPAWSINTLGNALFGDAQIRGTLIVGEGDEGTDEISDINVSIIKSYNYQRGTAGWAIKSNGWAEFRNLEANSITAEAIETVNPESIESGRISVNGDLLVTNRIMSRDQTAKIDITNKARTSNVATLTLAETHGRVVGDRAYVEVGKPSEEVIQYAASGGVATITTSVTHNLVVGDIVYGFFTTGTGEEIVLNRAPVATTPTATTLTVSDAAIADRASVGVTGYVKHVDTTFSSTNETDLFTITAVTETTISYSNTGSNVASTATNGHVVGYGRSVEISPLGLRLMAADGQTVVVDFPTDSAQAAKFAGTITASALAVSDNLLISGINNSVNAGSTLALSSNVPDPKTAPSLSFSWDGIGTGLAGQGWPFRTLTWNGTYYFTCDAENSEGHVAVLNTAGGLVARTLLAGSRYQTYVDTETWWSAGRTVRVYTDRKMMAYGMCMIGTKWYVLYWRDDGGQTSADDNVSITNWVVYRYDNNGHSGGPGTRETLLFMYNDYADNMFNCTYEQWKRQGSGGTLPNPIIGTDGTNIYMARTNLSGHLKISIFGPGGARNSEISTSTGINDHLSDMIVGNFDFGAQRILVSSWGSAGKPPSRIWSHTNTGVWSNSEDFWNGSQHAGRGVIWDSTASKFKTLTSGGQIWTHTSIAKSGANTWSTKGTWEDQSNVSKNVTNKVASGGTATLTVGTDHGFKVGDDIDVAGVDAALNGARIITLVAATTISFASAATITSAASTGTVTSRLHETAYSPTTTVGVHRRSKVTVSMPAPPEGSGGYDDPDRVRFYVSPTGSAGTFYRMPVLAAGGTSQTISVAPTSSTGTKAATFPAKTPATIKSSNGLLEISADGSIKASSITLGGAPVGKVSVFESASVANTTTATWTAVGSWAVGGVNNNLYGGVSGASWVVGHDGTYLITGQAQFATSTAGRRLMEFTVNGTFLGVQIAQGANGPWMGRISTVYPLSAGDLVQVMVYQNSGGNLALAGGHRLEITRLGPK